MSIAFPVVVSSKFDEKLTENHSRNVKYWKKIALAAQKKIGASPRIRHAMPGREHEFQFRMALPVDNI